MDAMHKLSPSQLAKREGHSRDFITALIKCGDLKATDERGPGASRPRYRITELAWREWEMSRAVTPTEDLPGEPVRRVGGTGLLARRRAARRMKMASI